MIKLGSEEQYIDADGSMHFGEIVYINEFNYVSMVNKESTGFSLSTVRNTKAYIIENYNETLLTFIGFGETDKENSFIVHNKPIADVDKKYRTKYKALLKSIKDSGYEGYEGIYSTFKIDGIPMCVNLNEVKEFYLVKSFMDDYLNLVDDNDLWI